ncbi:MAG: hypothetical protein JKY52_02130 [Flavobacteriales bacterium]|nr:hypothetical protein [Flavobacteriales bacterium]
MYTFISYLDGLITPFLLGAIYVLAKRTEDANIAANPVYRYYTKGLFIKLFSGIVICLIYVYYYGGGDTTAYYRGGVAMANLFMKDPMLYFDVLFGDVGQGSWFYYDMSTGWPPHFMFKDEKTYFVIQLVSVFLILTFKTFIPATILIAWLSYTGIWRMYLLFCEQFPHLTKHLATAILFMPSVVFWGSGMLKDAFTFSCVCWFVYAIYYFAIKKEKLVFHLFCLVVSSYLLITIKPYIFISLMPGSLLWVSFERIAAIKNVFIKIFVFPVVLSIAVGVIALIMSQVSGELGTYSSFDKVIEKATVNQEDLTRAEAYGDNFFDIGGIDPTPMGLLKKAPVAISATLFRPYMWEVRNPVMLLSALENTFIVFFCMWLLLRINIITILRRIVSNPLVLFSIMFSIFFAFAVGISTPNFGALVRYKIPAIPFFLSSLFILYYHNDNQGKSEPRAKKVAITR